MDLTSEVQWRTSRSGGKGGQNVNKVETAVEALWAISTSTLLRDDQKQWLQEQLHSRINKEGQVAVRASNSRSQLENKALALEKLHQLVEAALYIPKKRKATKPSKAAKERRLQSKRQNAFRKAQRRGDDL
ncbi:MAG: aminoacyl-tRNA hydrolase [Sphingobacteriales bacterium]|nr:MAG: aminoacyl-tRNA hydrolase [Sphingobacteriales bacterium]